MNRSIVVTAVGLGLVLTACDAFEDALTGHARPAAEAAGYRLGAEDLGRLMAESSLADSLLTERVAVEAARHWTDFVLLATVYDDPDSTRSVDYAELLEDGRYLATLAVERYRDSVILEGIEPSEEDVRRYWEERQPYTRLDVRRIALDIGEQATDSEFDSLFSVAVAIRERLVGGADFVQMARARSDEPAQARGQVLQYQGHDDFPAAADSVLFELQPGEISPVIATDHQILIYRIDGRRSPEFESARDQLYDLLREERIERRQESVLAEVVGGARRSVLRGATDLARRVATHPSLATGRVAGGTKLVTWEDGDFTVDELRHLFLARSDIRAMFAAGTDEELEFYLMELARDEILVTTAVGSGMAATAGEREVLAQRLADQLAGIATSLHITRQAIADPRFAVYEQSLWYMNGVLERSRATAWLGQYRVVLDPKFGARVDRLGIEVAARHARELRAAGVGPLEVEERPEMELPEERVEVG